MYLLAEVNLPSPSGTPVMAPVETPFFKLFGGFLAVAVVLVLCMWGLRVLARRQTGHNQSAQLSVLSRVALGRDSSVALVQMGTRVLAVGVTKDNISLLCELPAQECLREQAAGTDEAGGAETTENVPGGRASPVHGFFKRFAHNFGIVSGLAKGKQPLRPANKAQTASAPSFSDMLRQSQAGATQHPVAEERNNAAVAEAAAPAPPVSTASAEFVSAVPETSRTKENKPPDKAPGATPKTSVDYSATVAQMKNRARLTDAGQPMVLKPARAVEAAYGKQAVSRTEAADASQAGVVYIPSAPPSAPAVAVAPAAGEKRTIPAEKANSQDTDEMDRLMERVAARRDRLRRPELGKEQA